MFFFLIEIRIDEPQQNQYFLFIFFFARVCVCDLSGSTPENFSSERRTHPSAHTNTHITDMKTHK